MEKEERIKSEVEKTLHFLNQLEEIKTGSNFYARLQARIRREEKQMAPDRLSSTLRALRPVALVFLILINLVSLIFLFNGRTGKTDSRNERLSTLASEYSISQTDYYIGSYSGGE